MRAARAFENCTTESITTSETLPPVQGNAAKLTFSGECFFAAGENAFKAENLPWARGFFWQSGKQHQKQRNFHSAAESYKKSLLICIFINKTHDPETLRKALPLSPEERATEVDPVDIYRTALHSNLSEFQSRNTQAYDLEWVERNFKEQLMHVYREFSLEFEKIGNQIEADKYSEFINQLFPDALTDERGSTTPTLNLKVFHQIGQGRDADVWLGMDDLRDKLAVKLMRPQTYVSDIQNVVINHARKLCKVNHPNIVTIFYITKITDPISKKDIDAISMEFIEGSTLGEVLEKVIERENAIRIGNAIIEGLQELHENEIPHCDFHSNNVMCGNKSIKIIDIFSDKSTAQADKTAISHHKAKDIRDLNYYLSQIAEKTISIEYRKAIEFSDAVRKLEKFQDIQNLFNELFTPPVPTEVSEPREVGDLVTSESRDPLERMIAHRMRDSIVYATMPISLLLPRILGPDQAYPLNQIIQNPPKPKPGSEYVDSSVVQPIASAIATPFLLEQANVPHAPNGVRWIDWILISFNESMEESKETLQLYASRGPSVLIAQLEQLNRHLKNTLFMLQNQLNHNPSELVSESGSQHFAHTIKVLLKAQRVWLDFLEEWGRKDL